METVASLWACDPGDLGWRRHEPWAACGEFPPVAPLTWTEQLSPHLHRNKQLQDTLLQREEQLQRLQDENQELRRFLSSAFIRNLEHKVQRVAADRRKLKRNLEDLSIRRPLQVSKRVCRNLTARLNSASSESPASPEPNLDLWVLRTLGLKDRDTIDTSSQSSCDLPLRALVYDTVTPSPGHPLSSAHSPAHSPAHSYCPRVTPDPAGRSEANCHLRTALELNGLCRAVRTPPSLHPDRCTATNPSTNPAEYWSPSQGSAHFSLPAERLPSSPPWSPAWIPDRPQTPAGSSAPTSPPAATWTPCGRTDVAFRMSLSPSSSVKTHSFPQGQAFTCKDPDGRWSFTWVPRQEP